MISNFWPCMIHSTILEKMTRLIIKLLIRLSIKIKLALTILWVIMKEITSIKPPLTKHADRLFHHLYLL